LDLGLFKETMDAIILKEPAAANGTYKYFACLPEHLKTLLYQLSRVPGEPEPMEMVNNGKLFMKQYILARATSLLKTALRQNYGVSIMVRPAHWFRLYKQGNSCGMTRPHPGAIAYSSPTPPC
jgi:hypothetical protein